MRESQSSQNYENRASRRIPQKFAANLEFLITVLNVAKEVLNEEIRGQQIVRLKATFAEGTVTSPNLTTLLR